MSKKVDVIIETPPLLDILQSQSLSVEKQAGALYSEHYLTIGCDLEDVRRLHELLADRIDLQEAAILFIAEVSLTYMKVAAADSVIRWAASFPDGKSVGIRSSGPRSWRAADRSQPDSAC